MYDVVLEYFEIPRNLPLSLPAKRYVTHFAGHTIVFLHLQSTWFCLEIGLEGPAFVKIHLRMIWKGDTSFIGALSYGFFREVKEHCNEYRCEPDVCGADMLQLSRQGPHGQVRLHSSAILQSRWTFLSPQGLFGSKKGEGQFWADLLQLSGSRTHGQVNNNWIWSTYSCG